MSDNLHLFKVGTPVSTIRSFQVDRPHGMELKGRVYQNGEYIFDAEDFGHVVKFDRNCTGEVIIVVDWSTGDRTSIHPGNLTVLGAQSDTRNACFP